MKQHKNHLKVIVVGSGFGGMAVAIRLQARGMNVTLIEKRAKVGGRAYQFEEKGYLFDMGPSIITAPSLLRDLFEKGKTKMEDYFELIALDPFYRIYYHDRSYIDYNANSQQMMQQMAQFNPQDAKRYPEFIQAIKPIYDAVITNQLGVQSFHTFWKMISLIPTFLKLEAYLPAHFFSKRFFKDYRHQFLFSFHALFIGGNPFRVPAIYLMIPYLEKQEGVHFTMGGMYTVVRALQSLFVSMGGTIRLNEEVVDIKTKHKQAYGVQTIHKSYDADIVVSNADAGFTYRRLIDKKERKKWTDIRLNKLEYGMSCFVLYLGVRKKYPLLMHHTLILAKRYKGLIDDIFNKKILAKDFSLYLHVPSRTDRSMAPEGCESIYVLVPVPNLKGKIDWKTERHSFTKKIIRFLEEWGLDGLSEVIEVQKSFTPIEFLNELNTPYGSAFSIEPRFSQTAYFRPHNRSEDIHNLYFVGSGTHPGAGVPGVLLSAQATEACIVKDFSFNKKNPPSRHRHRHQH